MKVQTLMQRITAIFLAILAFFGIHLGAKTPETPADPVRYTVEGSTITFALDGNPTTGYEWTAQTDNDHIVLKNSVYEGYEAQENGVMLAGRGGVYYFTYEAKSAGTTKVTFHYARSWETTDGDQTVVWLVTVAEDGAITASQSA